MPDPGDERAGRKGEGRSVDGFDDAYARTVEAAVDKDVQIAGGASIVRQALERGVLDELQLHTAPVELGGGTPFPQFDGDELERIETPQALHVRYAIRRR